ncbi:MAG: HlyD family efflux transporter periplasmic adaptor subunit [Acidobacteria bacterium]|nr:HlyD family efflux transporter periplasmic adaptor subunit [Acidobacteriota bacterium]
MADDSLFRKAALDKLASPERLDVLMQVTSPKSWIALLTIAALLAGVVAWSIFGTLPERIDGQGMLTGEGGLRQIRASGDGRLTRLDLAVNQMVTPNQNVGEISAVTNDVTVDSALNDYNAQMQAHQAALGSEQMTISNLQIQRGRAQANLAKAEANLAQRKENLAAGIGTANQVRAAEAEVDSYVKEMATYDEQIRTVREQGRMRLINLQRLQQQVSSTKATVAARATISSTVTGKVVSVAKQVGDLVTAGELIAEVESGASEVPTLEIVAFVSSQTGQRVRPGHPAQITVAGVPREEFGFLRGSVKSVSQYPESPATIARVMGDGRISEASYRVVIDPTPDTTTPTGYAWSTGKGPNTQIAGGTGITVAVEVDQQRPISKVLPIIRGAIGG